MSLRVLLLVGHSTGGIGAHVASLAGGLPAHGVDVVVATSRATADRFDLGAHVEVAWPPRGRGLLPGLRRLRRLLAGADVVHAHGHQAGTLAVALARTLPRPRRPAVVVSWHNVVLGAGPGRAVRGLLEALQARRADLVTGASQDLVDRAASLGARAPELAPVAAPSPGTWRGDPALVRADLERSHSVPAGDLLVLTVSRIAPQKDLDVLVDAAARLGRDDVTWVVAGDGDPGLLGRLEERVRATGAPVRFLGARRDVGALMAVADVFALSSRWEARALVVQEAMAAGTPVVATDTGGLPELLSGSGVLVAVGDSEALADGVGRLLADADERRRVGEAGRARFATLPDQEDVVRAWAGSYAAQARR